MSDLAQLLETPELIKWTLENSHTVHDSPSKNTFSKNSLRHNDITINWLADGILELTPLTATNTDLVLSCGIHGNETAPIEMVETLFQQIINAELPLKCRLLIILGNLPAMQINKRFTEENLNRLFSANHEDNKSQEADRAALIEHWISDFYNRDSTNSENVRRIHLDLHTAIRGSKVEKFAIYPYQANGNWSEEHFNWLNSAGIQAVLLGHQPSGTFSYYTSATFGAMAFTIELGKALPFGENDHSKLIQFKAATEDLIAGRTLWQAECVESELAVYQVVDEILRLSDDDFSLNLADDFLNFTALEKDYKLTDDNPESYLIKESGHAIVFPNKNVPKGQRVALVIEPCDLRQIQ